MLYTMFSAILTTGTLKNLTMFYSIPHICLAINCLPCKTKLNNKQTHFSNRTSLLNSHGLSMLPLRTFTWFSNTVNTF